MNLRTAHAIGTFLERRGDGRSVGDRYTDRRMLLQYLKRYENLTETIDFMVATGLVDQRGSGHKGGGIREYAVTTTGGWFLSNIEKAKPFILLLEPELLDEFEIRAASKPGGAESELRKLIENYNRAAQQEADKAVAF